MNIVFAPPNGMTEVKVRYGDFTFHEQSGGNVMIDGSWMHDNLTVLHNVAGTGLNIQVHHLIAPLFSDCLTEALSRCPDYKIRMMGGHCARHQLHNPKYALSIHSWGAAVDLNWDTNPLGQKTTDFPDEFIAAFTEQGWVHGLGFADADPMHFQYATGV